MDWIKLKLLRLEIWWIKRFSKTYTHEEFLDILKSWEEEDEQLSAWKMESDEDYEELNK